MSEGYEVPTELPGSTGYCKVRSYEDLLLDSPGFRREVHGFNTKPNMFMKKHIKAAKAAIIVNKDLHPKITPDM